jgi:hypothetical protein
MDLLSKEPLILHKYFYFFKELASFTRICLNIEGGMHDYYPVRPDASVPGDVVPVEQSPD